MSANSTEALPSLPIFRSNSSVQLCISCMNLVYIILVVTVSLRVDKKDLCRVCTLWLFLVQLPSDGFQIVTVILQLTNTIEVQGFVVGEWNTVANINKLLQDMASQVYRTLALLLVCMTYTSYNYPFAYYKIFKPAHRSKSFLLGLLFLCLHVFVGNLLSWFTVEEDEDPQALVIAIRCVYYLVQFFSTAPIILITVMYCMSLLAIVQYAKVKARRGESIGLQRRQLLSVVIYSSAPNLLLFPIFVSNICSLILSHRSDDDSNYDLLAVLSIATEAAIYAAYMRVPVLTISTFIAFSPYRRVVFRLFTRSTQRIRVANFQPHTQTIVN